MNDTTRRSLLLGAMTTGLAGQAHASPLGCGLFGETFRPIARADLVRVLVEGAGKPEPYSSASLVATVQDPHRIGRLISFINDRRSGFATPWYGAPVGRVHAQIRYGATLISVFTAGTYFFQRAEFLTRCASREEVTQFMTILGLDPNLIRWR